MPNDIANNMKKISTDLRQIKKENKQIISAIKQKMQVLRSWSIETIWYLIWHCGLLLEFIETMITGIIKFYC